jgi:FtsZ-binding cell division protein ZapB
MSGKATSRRSTIALSILVAILIALLGLLYYNYSTTVSSKDLQISSLSSENEELRRRVSSLEGALKEKELAISSLASENEGLKKEVRGLQRNLSILSGMYEELRAGYEGLCANYTKLLAEHVVSQELLTLSPLFAKFDLDGDGILSWPESKAFFEWIKEHVKYRYDNENDPEGIEMLKAGCIRPEQLGDGRPGPDYWQRPTETVREGYGDCEDMAILATAFHKYWGVESYVAVVDVNGDGVVDHALCIVKFSEEALRELTEEQGITQFYPLNGSKFVVFDAAYSNAYGFIGTVDPITGEPIPEKEIDFSLYGVKTLEEIASERWIT